jgi:GntR family transcriptional regulator, transcriptional repressor for pyruvate dehydrogenase complex
LAPLTKPAVPAEGNPLEIMHVHRESLSVQVAQQIQRLIMQGDLRPGNRLPPERELSEKLRVSRTVVREATKLLQERGLVKVLTGSGTFVSKVEPSTIADSISLYMWGHGHAFHDLLEIRKMFEVEIAGLAAERATDEEVVELEAALAEMTAGQASAEGDAAGLEKFVRADLRFHHLLAKASKNSLLPLLLSPITELLVAFSRQASALPGAMASAIHFHHLLLRSIRDRDSQRSRSVMRDHLNDAENLLDQLPDGNKELPKP